MSIDSTAATAGNAGKWEAACSTERVVSSTADRDVFAHVLIDMLS